MLAPLVRCFSMPLSIVRRSPGPGIHEGPHLRQDRWLLRGESGGSAIVPEGRRTDGRRDPLSFGHRVSRDAFDLRGNLSRQWPHGERWNAFGQPEQRHVMANATIPLRVIDQLLHRVLGVPYANMEPATRWPGRRHRARGRHDPLRADQGAVALCCLRTHCTTSRIGARTGLKQGWWEERPADHHQRPDRERTSTHIILRAVTTGMNLVMPEAVLSPAVEYDDRARRGALRP